MGWINQGQSMRRWDPTENNNKNKYSTSLTIPLEYLLLTAVINMHEVRGVAVWDIPGEYPSADMDEEVTMILEGCLAEIMTMVEP